MKFIDDRIRLVNVDVNYLSELHQVSEEVRCAQGYQNKPFIGMLIQNDNMKYIIPLSSAKPKHKGWKDESNYCFLIYEIVDKSVIPNNSIYVSTNDSSYPNQVKHILSVLDLKKMIPVPEEVYSFIDVNAKDSDTKELQKYKDLLDKELKFCLTIKNKILEKAKKLYIKQTDKGNIRFCVDFTAVEKVCKKYCTMP